MPVERGGGGSVSERFPLIPLQHCLFTPELQWLSTGKWRILTENAWASCDLNIGHNGEQRPYAPALKWQFLNAHPRTGNGTSVAAEAVRAAEEYVL